jgi:hypothetical protein
MRNPFFITLFSLAVMLLISLAIVVLFHPLSFGV